jgi:hypothetical protein
LNWRSRPSPVIRISNWQGESSHSFSIVELHFTHRASQSEAMAIPVSRLILYVKDLARIAAFYQQHFGMKPLPGSGQLDPDFKPRDPEAMMRRVLSGHCGSRLPTTVSRIHI